MSRQAGVLNRNADPKRVFDANANPLVDGRRLMGLEGFVNIVHKNIKSGCYKNTDVCLRPDEVHVKSIANFGQVRIVEDFHDEIQRAKNSKSIKVVGDLYFQPVEPEECLYIQGLRMEEEKAMIFVDENGLALGGKRLYQMATQNRFEAFWEQLQYSIRNAYTARTINFRVHSLQTVFAGQLEKKLPNFRDRSRFIDETVAYLNKCEKPECCIQDETFLDLVRVHLGNDFLSPTKVLLPWKYNDYFGTPDGREFSAVNNGKGQVITNKNSGGRVGSNINTAVTTLPDYPENPLLSKAKYFESFLMAPHEEIPKDAILTEGSHDIQVFDAESGSFRVLKLKDGLMSSGFYDDKGNLLSSEGMEKMFELEMNGLTKFPFADLEEFDIKVTTHLFEVGGLTFERVSDVVDIIKNKRQKENPSKDSKEFSNELFKGVSEIPAGLAEAIGKKDKEEEAKVEIKDVDVNKKMLKKIVVEDDKVDTLLAYLSDNVFKDDPDTLNKFIEFIYSAFSICEADKRNEQCGELVKDILKNAESIVLGMFEDGTETRKLLKNNQYPGCFSSREVDDIFYLVIGAGADVGDYELNQVISFSFNSEEDMKNRVNERIGSGVTLRKKTKKEMEKLVDVSRVEDLIGADVLDRGALLLDQIISRMNTDDAVIALGYLFVKMNHVNNMLFLVRNGLLLPFSVYALRAPNLQYGGVLMYNENGICHISDGNQGYSHYQHMPCNTWITGIRGSQAMLITDPNIVHLPHAFVTGYFSGQNTKWINTDSIDTEGYSRNEELYNILCGTTKKGGASVFSVITSLSNGTQDDEEIHNKLFNITGWANDTRGSHYAGWATLQTRVNLDWGENIWEKLKNSDILKKQTINNQNQKIRDLLKEKYKASNYSEEDGTEYVGDGLAPGTMDRYNNRLTRKLKDNYVGLERKHLDKRFVNQDTGIDYSGYIDNTIIGDESKSGFNFDAKKFDKERFRNCSGDTELNQLVGRGFSIKKDTKGRFTMREKETAEMYRMYEQNSVSCLRRLLRSVKDKCN